MNWSLVGHAWAVNMLSSRLAQGRLSHSFLITGSENIGKSLLALRLAQAINCTGETPPCRECRSCTLFERGNHPDMHVVERDGSTIKIDSIREMQSELALQPLEARHRIAFIYDLHYATGSAMDSLLKTLEEPPGGATLIVTAASAELLLPTIVSRCQVIPLRPVPGAEIESGLINLFPDLDLEQAGVLARLSAGRPGWAIAAAQDPSMLEDRNKIIDDLIGLLSSNRTIRFAYAQELSRSDQLDTILEIWQTLWRDVLHMAEGSTVTPVNTDRHNDITSIAGTLTSEKIRDILLGINRTQNALERNANSRLTLDVMMLDLPYLAALH